MLQQHNILLFVIPSHTSHVTQLFDVGIASPMKSQFSTLLKSMMQNFSPDDNNQGQLRRFCDDAALQSWSIKSNYRSCTKAAKLTGIYPCDDTCLMKNKFVREITPEIEKFMSKKLKNGKKNELNINCEFLTSIEQINMIDEVIKCSQKHQHLCLKKYDLNYTQSITQQCTKNINDCYFLGRIPPYFEKSTNKLFDF